LHLFSRPLNLYLPAYLYIYYLWRKIITTDRTAFFISKPVKCQQQRENKEDSIRDKEREEKRQEKRRVEKRRKGKKREEKKRKGKKREEKEK